MDDELLTIDEVAKILKAHRMHVYRLMNSGHLPYVLIGMQRGRRIRRSVLEAFLKSGDRGMARSGDDALQSPEESLSPSQAAGFVGNLAGA